MKDHLILLVLNYGISLAEMYKSLRIDILSKIRWQDYNQFIL